MFGILIGHLRDGVKRRQGFLKASNLQNGPFSVPIHRINVPGIYKLLPVAHVKMAWVGALKL